MGAKVSAVVECAILRSSTKHRELHSQRTWSSKEFAAITGPAVFGQGGLLELLTARGLPKLALEHFAALAAAAAQAAKKASREVLPAVKVLVDICIAEGGGVTEDQVSDLVGKLPKSDEDKEFQKLVDFSKRFLQVMQQASSITPE